MKESKRTSGENGLNELKDEIARMKDELAKKNRDQLDAMYNLDMDNLSSDIKRLFDSWTDGITSANASITALANQDAAIIEMIAKIENGESSSFAEINARVTELESSITLISEWQNETDENIAAISVKTNNNGAFITQLVESVGADGTVNAASIALAISGEESLIQMIADKVKIEGMAEFVTKNDLSTFGRTTINGNNISLELPFVYDLNSTETAPASIRFDYDKEGLGNIGLDPKIAEIYTKYDGADTDIDSRFAIVIQTNILHHAYDVGNVDQYLPAIKLMSVGRLSLNGSKGVYAKGEYITLDGDDFTRIRADYKYSAIVNTPHSKDYVFASDGIYFNGVKILST